MLIVSSLLCLFSVIIISSSSTQLASLQAVYYLIGVVAYFLISKISYRDFVPFLKISYFLGLFLLLVVLFLGFETRGSIRWIPLGLFNLQPSELAKPILILCLANFWTKRAVSWMNILKSLGLIAPFLALILQQPDLGTALTVTFIWIMIIFSANISSIKVFIITLMGIFISPIVWFALHDYQKERLLTFLVPNRDPLGAGFHVIQSVIAVGSGGLFGRGLGHGTQSRLQFLPEFRTDFIFSFIAEELGLVGCMIILVLLSLLLYLGYKILLEIQDRFGVLIATGVLSMLFFQMTVNIGMNIGLMPVTGITLPLVSYGGSSVISIFICLGILNSVAKNKQKTNPKMISNF